MKTNVLMKIAVVFMAAFGAYAFSGTNLNAKQYKTFDVRIDDCTNLVIAECDIAGNNDCQVFINGETMPLFDLGCNSVIKHNSDTPVSWD